MRKVRYAAVFIAMLGVSVPLASAARPTIVVPPNMTVEAQSFGGASVTYAASATVKGRDVPVVCAPPSGSIFPLGETVISCTATDPEDDEDSSTRRFNITVVDRTPPNVTVPPSRSVRTRSRTGAIVSWTATASDLVDGPLVPSCAPASGTRFPVGTTQVVCAARDRRGNATSAAFLVTVSFVRTVKRSALFAPAAGSTVTAPPLLRWQPVRRARFYNLQLHRGGKKILTIWPTSPRYRLRRAWSYQGRRFSLRPGVYRWYIWPAFGTPARPRYGRLLGESSFRVR